MTNSPLAIVGIAVVSGAVAWSVAKKYKEAVGIGAGSLSLAVGLIANKYSEGAGVAAGAATGVGAFLLATPFEEMLIGIAAGSLASKLK